MADHLSRITEISVLLGQRHGEEKDAKTSETIRPGPQAAITQGKAGSSAPALALTDTPEPASAFITTSVQSPFWGSQTMFWLPGPELETAQIPAWSGATAGKPARLDVEDRGAVLDADERSAWHAPRRPSSCRPWLWARCR